MEKKTKILALVLARKGSKRLKNKNVRSLAGKPLICWTLDLLNKKKIKNLFEDILVSTDSQIIQNISKKYNFLSPWLRPKKLSNQFVSSESSALHALLWYEKNIKKIDALFLFQPTSPFRTEKKIINAIKTLSKNKDKQVISICSKKTYKFKKGDINGSIYLTPVTIFKKFKTFKKKEFLPLRTYSALENIDIDTFDDLVFAENMLK